MVLFTASSGRGHLVRVKRGKPGVSVPWPTMTRNRSICGLLEQGRFNRGYNV